MSRRAQGYLVAVCEVCGKYVVCVPTSLTAQLEQVASREAALVEELAWAVRTLHRHGITSEERHAELVALLSDPSQAAKAYKEQVAQRAVEAAFADLPEQLHPDDETDAATLHFFLEALLHPDVSPSPEETT